MSARALSRKRARGGIIWTLRPPKPLSPHQEERACEFALILELAAWMSESWADRAEGADDGQYGPIAMLLAATRWLCLLSLPESRLDLFRGPPVLSRVSAPPEVATAPGTR